MHSPPRAILWQIFWRCRWGFLAAGAFLLLAVMLCHLLPTRWTIHVEDDEVPAVGWFLGVVCLFINVLLMAPFAMSGEDTRNFTFAKHMFVLPTPTSALVAWPMISGCLLVAAMWLINASFVFRPTGIAAPLWWPAAALALFLAIFQALAWTPFAQRWLHGAFTVVIVTSPLLLLLLGVALDVQLNEFMATMVLVALLPIAYVAAYSGIARARRAGLYDWRTWGRFTDWLARRRPAATHPFRSMSRAQLWYECRAHLIVPVFIVCMLPCFIFVTALPGDATFAWRLLGILLCAPILVAMLSGAALSNLVDPLSIQSNGSFVLARPISSAAIVRSKLLMAAITTAVIWILFLGFISLLLLRPEFFESVKTVARGAGPLRAVGYPLLALLLLVLLTWKSIVETYWVGLTGRKWVELTFNFALIGLLASGVALGIWLTFRPEWRATALATAPWLMGLLLTIKLSAGVCVVQGLLRWRLATISGACLMIAAWLAMAFSLVALALTLLPPAHAPAMTIISGVALLIPFARLAGAPLALQWNRHR